MGKPADPCQEYEPDVFRAALEIGVHGRKLFAEADKQLLVMQVVDQRLVILVHKNHDPLAGLLISSLDD